MIRILDNPVQSAGESAIDGLHFEARHSPDAPEIWHHLIQAVWLGYNNVKRGQQNM